MRCYRQKYFKNLEDLWKISVGCKLSTYIWKLPREIYKGLRFKDNIDQECLDMNVVATCNNEIINTLNNHANKQWFFENSHTKIQTETKHKIWLDAKPDRSRIKTWIRIFRYNFDRFYDANKNKNKNWDTLRGRVLKGLYINSTPLV